MDKFECIRVFRQVVESNGFAAAGRKMGLSRSTVNKYVARLENELGTQLLARSTRRVSPTEAGQAFYDSCLGILNDLEEAISAVSEFQEQPRGRLRVNAPMSFGTLHLSKAVAAFMKLHEKVHIELDLSDRFIDPIEEGFDVTIRISEPQVSTSLMKREIARTRRVICASPNYLEKHGEPKHPRDLHDHRCLQYGHQTTGSHWQLTGPDGAHSIPITCAMRSNNGEVLRDAAVLDQGIAILPTFIAARDLESDRLREILHAYQPHDVTICAIYPRHRHLSTKVQMFVQFMIDRFSGNASRETNQ